MSSSASLSTSPSSSRTPGHVFTERDCSLFRIMKIISDVVTSVLLFILDWSTKREKHKSMTYWHYFTVVKGLSWSKLKQMYRFDATMKHALETKPPEKFDVSLLSACIMCVCSNHKDVQDLLDCLKAVKDFRNKIVHEGVSDGTSLRPKSNEVEELLKLLIEKAKIAFKIPDDEISKLITEMTNNINKICSERFSPSDMANYLILEKLRSDGLTNLQKYYGDLTYITPLHYLHEDTSLLVSMVYTELKMVTDDKHTSGHQVKHTELLETIRDYPHGSPRKKAKIILVEGPAGSGKTTLTRLLIKDWIEKDSEIKGLVDFEFLLHVECRTPHIEKFTKLLEILMPDVAKDFTGDEILQCLRGQKVLVIADGLDEMNSNSKNLFHEILYNTKSSNLCVLATTRAEAVELCYDLRPVGTCITKIRILGIPESKREEFAIKYHEQMCHTHTECDTNNLVHYLRKMSVNFADYWRIPNNLCKLVMLRTLWPDTLDGVTTETELLMEMEVLITKKIKERVIQKPEYKDLHPADIIKKIDIFFRPELYRLAFCGQRKGLALSGESERALISICDNLKLPHTEVLGGFFVQRNVWTKTGTSTKYSYTHRGMQDFYAALYILHNLRSLRNETSSERIIRDMFREQDIKKFQEVLKHLIGLLYTEETISNHEASKEVVQLLEESGVRDKDAWLHILSNVKANDVIANLVSKYVPDVMHLRGHTVIKDSNVAAYAKLLKTANPKKVTVSLRNNPDIVPSLQDLFQTICLLTSEVEICFLKVFREPSTTTSVIDTPLVSFFKSYRGTIKKFKGRANDEVLAGLPESIVVLYVSVADYRQLEHLISTIERLKRLQWLCIHAVAGLDVRSQPALSNINHILYETDGVDTSILLNMRTKALDKPHLEELVFVFHRGKSKYELDVDKKFLLTFDKSHLYAALDILRDCMESDDALRVKFHFEPKQRRHSEGESAEEADSSVSAREESQDPEAAAPRPQAKTTSHFGMLIQFGNERGDCDMQAYWKVTLDIPGDPEDIPSLRELVAAVGEMREIYLYLHHDFQYPRDGGSILDETLNRVFQRDRLPLTEFKGQLSGSAMAALPSSLQDLRLAVKDDDHYRALLPALSSLPRRLPRLKILGLHVDVGLDAASLRPLPDVDFPSLWVTGVEEATVEEANRVVAALQPSEGHFWLFFPGALVHMEAFVRLVEQLSRQEVRVRGRVFASPRVDAQNQRMLRQFLTEKLNCGFYMRHEEDIWREL